MKTQSRGSVHPTFLPSSAEIWQLSQDYSRKIKGLNIIVFENQAVRERRQAKLWVHSDEKFSAAFDIRSINTSVLDFYGALLEQYLEVTEASPVRLYQAIAFDSSVTHLKVCAIGIRVEPFTLMDTPTLKPSSSVFRVALDRPPLQRKDSTFAQVGT